MVVLWVVVVKPAAGRVLVVDAGAVELVDAPVELVDAPVVPVVAPGVVVVVAPPVGLVVAPPVVLVGPWMVVVVAAGVAQLGRVILFLSKVTWPFRAIARPDTVLPVSKSTSVSAMMVPTNVVLVSSVAELVTCQNTLQGRASPMRATVLSGAVIKAEPTWKMNTASGLLPPSRISVPVRSKVDVAL